VEHLQLEVICETFPLIIVSSSSSTLLK